MIDQDLLKVLLQTIESNIDEIIKSGIVRLNEPQDSPTASALYIYKDMVANIKEVYSSENGKLLMPLIAFACFIAKGRMDLFDVAKESISKILKMSVMQLLGISIEGEGENINEHC